MFFKGYFSGRFSRRLAAISGVSELALYVIFAVPLDALALALVKRWFGLELDFDLVAQVLLGQNTQDAATTLAQTTSDTWAVSAPIYFSVLVGSFLLGNLVRKIVWILRGDVRFPFFRMRQEWYYVLQGRLPTLPRHVIPYADVLIQEPGGTKLYQGIVSSFEVDQGGNISQLILRDAYKGQHGPSPTQFTAIPGDRFVVMGSAIHSINMRYIVPGLPPPQKWSKAPKRRAMAALRRFFLEEP